MVRGGINQTKAACQGFHNTPFIVCSVVSSILRLCASYCHDIEVIVNVFKTWQPLGYVLIFFAVLAIPELTPSPPWHRGEHHEAERGGRNLAKDMGTLSQDGGVIQCSLGFSLTPCSDLGATGPVSSRNV